MSFARRRVAKKRDAEIPIGPVGGILAVVVLRNGGWAKYDGYQRIYLNRRKLRAAAGYSLTGKSGGNTMRFAAPTSCGCDSAGGKSRVREGLIGGRHCINVV